MCHRINYNLCVNSLALFVSLCGCVCACRIKVCLCACMREHCVFGFGFELLGVIVSTCKLSAERIDKRSKLVKLSF